MKNYFAAFAAGVLVICQFVMRGMAAIDAFLTRVMDSLGLVDPQWQIYLLLVVTAALVVFALRVLGGLIGWVVLIFLVLLLAHRLVPGIAPPQDMLQEPLSTAL